MRRYMGPPKEILFEIDLVPGTWYLGKDLRLENPRAMWSGREGAMGRYQVLGTRLIFETFFWGPLSPSGSTTLKAQIFRHLALFFEKCRLPKVLRGTALMVKALKVVARAALLPFLCCKHFFSHVMMMASCFVACANDGSSHAQLADALVILDPKVMSRRRAHSSAGVEVDVLHRGCGLRRPQARLLPSGPVAADVQVSASVSPVLRGVRAPAKPTAKTRVSLRRAALTTSAPNATNGASSSGSGSRS